MKNSNTVAKPVQCKMAASVSPPGPYTPSCPLLKKRTTKTQLPGHPSPSQAKKPRPSLESSEMDPFIVNPNNPPSSGFQLVKHGKKKHKKATDTENRTSSDTMSQSAHGSQASPTGHSQPAESPDIHPSLQPAIARDGRQTLANGLVLTARPENGWPA